MLANLAGYVVGTLFLSPLADRYGRRNMLMATMALTGVGSLYNALAPDYTHFVIARIITGFGIGADLAIVNTFIGEVAPRRSRARFTSLIFTMSAAGALLGIWLGLFLTTEAEPWPHGLPFAQAGPGFETGWRWMYGLGALLALVAILLRFELPESPRWLVGQGRLDEADAVVGDMEAKASKHGPLPEPDAEVPVERTEGQGTVPFRELFSDPTYVRRIALLLSVWFFGYVTVYGFSSGFTSVLTALGYAPPEAGVIVAVGVFGFVLCAVAAALWGERLDRKLWLPISAVITLAGGAIIAAGGDTRTIAFLGAIVVFFGFNLWVPMTYARSAESFPTRARTTGFALVDGVGHLGGGIGVLLIAPLVPKMSTLGALSLIGGFLAIAAVLGMFGVETRNKRFEDVCPSCSHSNRGCAERSGAQHSARMPAAGEMRFERMIDILTALGAPESADAGGLGVVRIAELVGREKSQVSRALRALDHAGLVERDEQTREYRLGWRLFTLAARVGDQRLLALAPPVLHGLVAALGETAHLSVRDGAAVVTLLSESSPSVVRAIEWTGRAVPAHCTSAGRALLLDHEADALRALLGDGELPAAGPDAPRDIDALARRTAAARKLGYAATEDEFEAGHAGVAAPVRDFRGRIVAALNVSAPAFRLGGRRLDAAGREIRARADELSARLAGQTTTEGTPV